MKKRVVLLTMMFLLCLSSVAYAAEVNITLDSKPIDAKGVIVGGRTMVPIRDIAEAMGLTVVYNDATGGVDLYEGEFRCGSINGSSYQKVTRVDVSDPKRGRYLRDDTENLTSDVPMQVINGKSMVPLAVIANIIDGGASWDGQTNTAVVKTWKVLAKERDEAKLLAQFADGSLIDLINDIGTRDRGEYWRPISDIGFKVQSLHAEWDIYSECWRINCKFINTTGKSISGDIYICMFEKTTGKIVKASTGLYKNDWGANIAGNYSVILDGYDPELHEVDVLAPRKK